MKRLAIYFFYDKDGIVDNYVPYFLQNLKPFCEKLCVVVNGNLTEKSRELLETISDDLIIRENQGYDSWAYKRAIEYYGYDKLKEYDEVLLSNYTFFGPIYPLNELFDEMTKTDCDFWGIHRHPKINYRVAETEIIEHIQSHFIVFRNKILSSPHFQNYWQTLQPVHSYDEAITRHELRCTKYFEDLGYKSNVFLNDKFYMDSMTNASIHYAFRQIVSDHCPILKRKFIWINNNTLECPQFTQESALDLIYYLRNNTDYNTDLIWDNLIRTQNITTMRVRKKDIFRFHKYRFLRWIFPWKFKKYTSRSISLKNSRLIDYENLKKTFGK